MRGCLFDLSSTVCFRSSLRDVPKRDQVPPFLQRSPPPLLTAAACSGLHPAPDRRMRGARPHLLHSSIPPSPSVCSWHTMVETFPSDRADQPLDVWILPRRSGSSRLVPNAHGTQPLPEDHAIRSVSVPNKIARCTVPGKRLDDLARNPLRGRICRHPERYPQSAPVTQNHKAIEQPERYRRQHEEVDCRDAIDMIGQKGPPALRRRPTAVHIACDR